MNIIFWILAIIGSIFVGFFIFILIGMRIERKQRHKQMLKDLDEFYNNNKRYF